MARQSGSCIFCNLGSKVKEKDCPNVLKEKLQHEPYRKRSPKNAIYIKKASVQTYLLSLQNRSPKRHKSVRNLGSCCSQNYIFNDKFTDSTTSEPNFPAVVIRILIFKHMAASHCASHCASTMLRGEHYAEILLWPYT